MQTSINLLFKIVPNCFHERLLHLYSLVEDSKSICMCINKRDIRKSISFFSYFVYKSCLTISYRHKIRHEKSILLYRLQIFFSIYSRSKLKHASILRVFKVRSHANSITIVTEKILTNAHALDMTLLYGFHFVK